MACRLIQSNSLKESEQKEVNFKSFENALETKWDSVNQSNLKKFRRRAHPLFFSLLTIWHYVGKYKTIPKEEFDEVLMSCHQNTMETVGCTPNFVEKGYLESLICEWNTEISSVCSVLGGVLSQEVLKCIAANETPMHNFLCFDGNDSSIQVLKLK